MKATKTQLANLKRKKKKQELDPYLYIKPGKINFAPPKSERPFHYLLRFP